MLVVGEQKPDGAEIRCFDVETGKEIYKLKGNPQGAYGKEVIVSNSLEDGGQLIRILDAATGKELCAKRTDGGNVVFAGGKIAISKEAGTTEIWTREAFGRQP